VQAGPTTLQRDGEVDMDEINRRIISAWVHRNRRQPSLPASGKFSVPAYSTLVQAEIATWIKRKPDVVSDNPAS
jgi:hypothetical protein